MVPQETNGTQSERAQLPHDDWPMKMPISKGLEEGKRHFKHLHIFNLKYIYFKKP